MQNILIEFDKIVKLLSFITVNSIIVVFSFVVIFVILQVILLLLILFKKINLLFDELNTRAIKYKLEGSLEENEFKKINKPVLSDILAKDAFQDLNLVNFFFFSDLPKNSGISLISSGPLSKGIDQHRESSIL